MDYYIGLDLGSTAVKGSSVDCRGDVLTVKESVPFLSAVSDDTVEIDPGAYVEVVFSLIRRLVRKDCTLKAISYAAASGNLMLLDRKLSPLAPMYSWLDTRPADGSITVETAGIDSDDVYRIVGWPFSEQFPLGRIMWLKKNYPDLLRQTFRICMNNDYLGYRLTGRWALDPSTATTMYFYDQKTGQVSRELTETAGIDGVELSSVFSTGTRIGRILSENCNALGIEQNEAPYVVLGSFDHPAAARAVGLKHESQLMLSCGTSWVGCVVFSDRSVGFKHKLLIDPFTSNSGGKWFGMFSNAMIGKRFNSWVADYLSFFEIDATNPLQVFDHSAMEAEISDVPVIGIDQDDIKKTFEKLRKNYSRQAIARGLLEIVVFEFAILMESKEIAVDSFSEILLVGGPTESPIWPQIISDMLNRPVKITFGQTAGSTGAAMIAASGMNEKLVPDGEPELITPNKDSARLVRSRYEEYMRGNCD